MELGKLKFNRMEFAGALGDLGTLVPVMIAMVRVNGLNPMTILLLVGLFYIVSGVYYRLPIPVQPLKGLAAIAIATSASVALISAAGILMGIILLFLALTGLTRFLGPIFAKPVIRGIQLGVGLMLIRTALSLIVKSINLSLPVPWLSAVHLPMNALIVSSGAILLLVFLGSRSFPASLVVIGFGVLSSILTGKTPPIAGQFFPLQGFHPSLPSLKDFSQSFFLLVIPQLPLTLGNSIIATKAAADAYFGTAAKKVTHRSLALGLGMANLLVGLFAGMPVCHGCGGLSAHYSFGARTGGATIIIGTICLSLALAFGGQAGELFQFVPYPILGVMLAYVGFRHCLLISDLKDKKEILVTLIMGILAIFRNMAFAYAMGITLWYLLVFLKKVPLPKLIPWNQNNDRLKNL